MITATLRIRRIRGAFDLTPERRWRNDANFFPIIAETKALPRLLGEVREQIAAAWDKYSA